MITEEQISSLAKQFKIDSYSILREYLQILFLKYFYELKESQKVYFKGGTAIHFLYGSFRFSEDLDFTSLSDATQLRKLLAEVIGRMSYEVQGLELVNLGIKKHALNQVIKYHYGLTYPLTVRLEFSLRERPVTYKVSPIETPFPVTAYPLVVHIDAEELLAEKVRALLIRQKGRDLFDLWFLLSKGLRINDDLVQIKMRWYKKTYDIADLISSVKEFKEKVIENDLRKFLPKNYRPFIRELKNKTLEKLFTAPH